MVSFEWIAQVVERRDTIVATIVLAAILGFGLAETLWPRRRSGDGSGVRWAGNVALAFLNVAAISLLVPEPAAVVVGLSIGVLEPAGYWLRDHPVAAAVAGVLGFDLLHYGIHRLFHALPLLWRIHAVHHSDVDVDVTTAVRHHPFEHALVFAGTWVCHGLLGLPLSAIVAYSILVAIVPIFHHANLRLPEALENAIGTVIVTPRMHVVHHSIRSEEGNSNYGNLFPWWDRLFGTLRMPAPGDVAQIRLGLVSVPAAQASSITALLAAPFRRG